MSVKEVNVATRMRWAAGRETTRGEDIAFCLLGIFDIHMPILYGQGRNRAFRRLQEEILKNSSDESIFAWQSNDPARLKFGLLAESPDQFYDCRDMVVSSSLAPKRPFRCTAIAGGFKVLFCMRKGTQHGRDKSYTVFLNCRDSKGRCPTFVIVQVDLRSQFARLGPLTIQDYGMDLQGVICVPHDPVPRTDKPSINFQCVYKQEYGTAKAQVYAPSSNDWEHLSDTRMRCRVPQAMDNSYIAALTITWHGTDSSSSGKDISCVLIICVVPDVTLQCWVCYPMIQEDADGRFGILPEYKASASYRQPSNTAVSEEWNYSRLDIVEHVLTVAVPSWTPCELNGEGQVDVVVILEAANKTILGNNSLTLDNASTPLSGILPPAKRNWVRYPRAVNVSETFNGEKELQKIPGNAGVVTRSKETRSINVKSKSNNQTSIQQKEQTAEEAKAPTFSTRNPPTPLDEETKPSSGILVLPEKPVPQKATVPVRFKQNAVHPLNDEGRLNMGTSGPPKRQVSKETQLSTQPHKNHKNVRGDSNGGIKPQPKQKARLIERGRKIRHHRITPTQCS